MYEYEIWGYGDLRLIENKWNSNFWSLFLILIKVHQIALYIEKLVCYL